MRVLLIAHTQMDDDIPGYVEDYGYLSSVGDCDEIAEEAGRLCYLSWERPNPDTATNKGYLKNIINRQHFSVLEHSSATFYIDGVSRNLTHELIRHRHLSFSEVSQRYVNIEEFKEVTPPLLEEYLPNYSSSSSSWKDMYSGIYNFLTEKGMKRKAARQTARYFAPSGLETKILVTGNMRAWREMLTKRLSSEADKEIQLVSQKILKHLAQIAPNTFQDFE